MKEPKTLPDFRKWLKREFAELQTVVRLDDFYTSMDAGILVEEARRYAARFGVDPGEEVTTITPRKALAILGGLLVWAGESKTDVLTVKQAADRLNVSPRTVYDLCESGQLRCQRIGTGRGTIRIRPADLDRIPQESARRLA